MLGTYATAVVVLAAAATVGQAVFALCGRRRWSWLAPAVGLAAIMPVAWWAVRLPGHGGSGLAALLVVTLACGICLRGRVAGLAAAGRTGLPVLGLPVLAVGLLAASLPFLVEHRFGILGTGLNPDMSQHLFAADRLAEGGSERLISEGYPLGPHALALAVGTLGPSLVQAFGGVTVATAVIACLTPLSMLGRLSAQRRVVAALLVGLAYMSAAYLIQGAFKETMQSLFVLAFAIGLERSARGRLAGRGATRIVPLAILGVGSAYTYSFPGLIWIVGAGAAWAALELLLAARRRGRRAAARALRDALVPAGAALGVFVLAVAPELGRMIEFASFETFDPDGAGLGNLFNPLSPLESLGIWPSGDFRLDPGAGFAPVAAFWVGGAVALAALGFGLWWSLRRGELAVPAALGVAAALVAYANLAGTPYQEAKAIAMAAPLTMLLSVRALASEAPTGPQVAGILRRRGLAALLPRSARVARVRLWIAALAVAFTLGAAACTVLVLANGPVGPSRWGPGLLELGKRPGATLALAPSSFLEDEHGRDLLVWELRGGRVCVEAYAGQLAGRAPAGIRRVIVVGEKPQAPFAGTGAPRELGGYTLWEIPHPTPGASGCAFVSDGARADPGDAG